MSNIREQHRLSAQELQKISNISMDSSFIDEQYTNGNITLSEYMDARSYLEWKIGKIVMGDLI